MSAAATIPKPKKEKKSVPRTVKLVYVDSSKRLGGMRITVGKESWWYTFQEVEDEFGRAFTVQKHDGATVAACYHVQVIVGNEDFDRCDCPGHQRWGHCKHVSCMRKLIAEGKLWQ